ncbi:hypothetical protein ACR5MH_0510 (plasmid) [Streptomyces sp. L7]
MRLERLGLLFPGEQVPAGGVDVDESAGLEGADGQANALVGLESDRASLGGLGVGQDAGADGGVGEGDVAACGGFGGVAEHVSDREQGGVGDVPALPGLLPLGGERPVHEGVEPVRSGPPGGDLRPFLGRDVDRPAARSRLGPGRRRLPCVSGFLSVEGFGDLAGVGEPGAVASVGRATAAAHRGDGCSHGFW